MVDGSGGFTCIIAFGSGLWLQTARSVKSESLGLGSGHEYLKKKNLPGGSDVELGVRILGLDSNTEGGLRAARPPRSVQVKCLV